jgi:hypothetical protein
MSQRSRFFDSSAGDRVYTSDAWAQVIAALQSTGIVPGLVDELLVHESSPAALSVRVKLGTALILGYYFEVYAAEETLALAAADATNPRIDRIVARRSLANREVALAVLTGTPAASPTAPALTTNVSGTYEIPLAQVLVAALATSVVDANITDERGTRSSGYDLVAALSTATGHDHDGSDSKTVAYANIASKPSTFAPSDHGHTAGGDGGTIPYSVITGKPSSFTPSSHTHADGSNGGTVAYSVITGKPSTFAPTAHAAAHGSAGGDKVTVHWNDVSNKPSTFAPTAHAIDGASHTGSYPWADISGKPATFAPSSHSIGSHTGDAGDINGWRRQSAGGGAAGNDVYVGTTDPGGSAGEGDVWIKA